MSQGREDGDKLVRLRPSRRCAECGKPADREYWPFCSRRCADLDLNRWLSGHYRIAGAESDEPAEGEGGAKGGDDVRQSTGGDRAGGRVRGAEDGNSGR